MEYFKLLWKKDNLIQYVDSPIRFIQAAILQDTVDNQILGRVKFMNQGTEKIIALQLKYCCKDVFGQIIEPKSRIFLYQDLNLLSGDIAGNKNAIELPNDCRELEIIGCQIVTAEGSIHRSENWREAVFSPPEEIMIPKHLGQEVAKQVRNDFGQKNHFYFYYEQNNSEWRCPCGKVHDIDKELCDFCCVRRENVKDSFSKDSIRALVLSKGKAYTKKKLDDFDAASRNKESERVQLIALCIFVGLIILDLIFIIS